MVRAFEQLVAYLHRRLTHKRALEEVRLSLLRAEAYQRTAMERLHDQRGLVHAELSASQVALGDALQRIESRQEEIERWV